MKIQFLKTAMQFVFAPMMALAPIFLCAADFDAGRNGLKLTVSCNPDTVDIAGEFYLSATAECAKGEEVSFDSIEGRLEGFSVSESFREPDTPLAEGGRRIVQRWKLLPDAAAPRYRIKPFVVKYIKADGTDSSYAARAVVFGNPRPVESDRNRIEVPLEKIGMDVGEALQKAWNWIVDNKYAALGFFAAGLILAFLAILVFRFLRRAVKERLMSPFERAGLELDRLLRRNLPGKGLFKDFYIELTMVVRRYVERSYGLKAPKLTTEEFLAAAQQNSSFGEEQVKSLAGFLQSADMVKFAGMEATEEMADGAVESARAYLRKDSSRNNPGDGK